MTNPQCYKCGRFVSLAKKIISFVSYGDTYDFEPPEREFVCGNCWPKMDQSNIDLLNRSSWIKPHWINN